MNNRTEEKLKSIEGMKKAMTEILAQAWERGRKYGRLEAQEEKTQGNWGKWVISEIRCPNCLEYFQTDCYSMGELNKCPNCEAKMFGEEDDT